MSFLSRYACSRVSARFHRYSHMFSVFLLSGPACKAWWRGALCSSSLLLVQMLWSVLRSVSSFEHLRTSHLALHTSTEEHLALFFQDQPECLKYFYQEKVPEWGSSTPGAARLCQRFDNRCTRTSDNDARIFGNALFKTSDCS